MTTTTTGRARPTILHCVTWLNDDTSQWAAGLITITDERLRWRIDKDTGELGAPTTATTSAACADRPRPDIYWLWGGLQDDLPRNLLLHMEPAARDRIFSFPRSGQARVDQLFREVQESIVSRQMVLTVAQQDDAPKRARDARLNLRKEGLLVLGHQESHPHVAARSGASRPGQGRVDRGTRGAGRADRQPPLLQRGRATLGTSSTGRARALAPSSRSASTSSGPDPRRPRRRTCAATRPSSQVADPRSLMASQA